VETTALNDKGIGLYHIHGTTDMNTRAIQVKEVAGSLNSSDCFALVTPGGVHLWCGKGANENEKKVATNIANLLKGSRTVKNIEEGKESNEFWAFLGGKAEYSTSKELLEGMKEPRLFQCSTVLGSFKVSEIFNFSQDDLINDDVMILDTFSEVFVWVGHESTKEEKDLSMKTALDYVKNAPDGRSADTPVYRVFAGSEPPNFTCHFYGWDSTKASDFTDPYTKGLGKIQGGSATTEQKGVEKVSESMIGFTDPTKQTYTYAQMSSTTPPANIDPHQKEQYLSDDEFKKVLGITKAEFNNLSKWKKDEAKKKHKLF